MTEHKPNDRIDTKQVAAILNVRPSAVANWRSLSHNFHIPYEYAGRKIVYKYKDVILFKEKNGDKLYSLKVDWK